MKHSYLSHFIVFFLFFFGCQKTGQGISVAYKQDSSPLYTYELFDHLGNARAIVERDRDPSDNLQIAAINDYYPFGWKLPNRTFESLRYRFGYQGQFAEEDEVTEMSLFELRQWDGRVGRWANTDLYDQFHSPYLGMGNNPVMMIDEDGGEASPDWYQNEETRAVIWQKGSAETITIDGDIYQNIGETYNYPFYGTLWQVEYDQFNASVGIPGPDYIGGAGGLEMITGYGLGALKMFMGAIRMFRAANSTDDLIKVYRVWGGRAREFGESWTTVNPQNFGKLYRKWAGLPNTNSGNRLIQGYVKASDIHKVRPALPLGKNSGGLPEVIIKDASTKVINSSNVLLKLGF